MTETAPAFLTGGTGVVGRVVLSHLVEAGRPVVALARSAESARRLEAAGARAVPGDVLDGASLRRAMEGCAVAYHLAGANIPCLRDASPLFEVNVAGSRNLVEAAAAAGVVRVVYTSSASTIGERRGEVGTEDTPHRGWFLSNYERSKWEAERLVLDRAAALGVDVVSVNPSSVQGPGRADGSARLLVLFVTGRLRFFVPTRLSLVDVDDCARGHLLAAAKGVAGRRYILSAPACTVEEALALLAAITGIARRPRQLPARVASAAGTAAEVAGRLTGRRPAFCREVVATILHGHAYDGSRAERELGLRYRPVEETLRRTLAWLMDAGVVPSGTLLGA